ncbi:hypothetical protein E2C01_018986 [Portunus trituberculatus]|uniref:Uncharacterized protein n=1 Tax=Portunus trituberculatus TaxID=210409 RepID=A0A5B7DY16_PORTR|nr:hypothetical protein [Portunus trituberculatus]
MHWFGSLREDCGTPVNVSKIEPTTGKPRLVLLFVRALINTRGRFGSVAYDTKAPQASQKAQTEHEAGHQQGGGGVGGAVRVNMRRAKRLRPDPNVDRAQTSLAVRAGALWRRPVQGGCAGRLTVKEDLKYGQGNVGREMKASNPYHHHHHCLGWRLWWWWSCRRRRRRRCCNMENSAHLWSLICLIFLSLTALPHPRHGPEPMCRSRAQALRQNRHAALPPHLRLRQGRGFLGEHK